MYIVTKILNNTLIYQEVFKDEDKVGALTSFNILCTQCATPAKSERLSDCRGFHKYDGSGAADQELVTINRKTIQV